MNDDTSGDGQQRRDVFDVGEDRALDALALAWDGEYDEIWVSGGAWFAHRKDAGEGEFLTGATPDELNAEIRADLTRRGVL
jgi:hypothetical protein